ncbi:hypothetical protein CRI94_01205 [Longibacter salinarum]|uniref:LTD domain-containing protein n=1 Tax=Longibacter salinarum TaxID=1850348 RepID=A0A2A8D1V6_9BACT|nr:lamin tail domain-containing protein [Longibacter salinarum]PEN14939.1 hypothetical protein CRI94_01205 [Longibacter salinarum]
MIRLVYVAIAFGCITTGLAASSSEPGSSRFPSGPLVINEVHAAPNDSDAEFIEILNRSDRTLPLSELTYADANEDFDPVVPASGPPLPSDLPPGHYLVLVRDSTAAARAFPDLWTQTPSDAIVVAPPGWEGLNNGGDVVNIRIGGNLSDQLTYDGDWFPRNTSLERIDPNGPSAAFNVRPSTNGASPGRRNTQYAPDTTAPKITFAEERPDEAGGEPKVRLYLDEGVASQSVHADNFEVRGRPVHDATLHEDLRTIDLAVKAPLRDQSDSPLVSASGLADRTGNARDKDEIIVALQPTEGDLRWTEIMYDPRADGHDGWPDQSEYLEMVNLSTYQLTLHGLQVTGATDEHGETDQLAAVSQTKAISPQSYALIYASGDLRGSTPEERQSSLNEAFPDMANSGGVLIEEDRSSLRLTNSGRSIVLRSEAGELIDSLLYDPDWHADDLASTDGVSLAKISLTAESTSLVAWTSSAHPDGGTPGHKNSVHLPQEQSAVTASVTVSPSPFSRSRDGATRIQYHLERPAGTIRVRIYDAHGRLVRTLVQSKRTGSEGELLWDGRTDDGHAVRMGIYVVLFESVDVDGASLETARAPVVVARER